MTMDVQSHQNTYKPAISIVRITAKHTLGRIPIAPIDTPESICGTARRVGYTGRLDSDLAIYRLKVKNKEPRYTVTLPGLFVVDEGVFVDYEQWRHRTGDS